MDELIGAMFMMMLVVSVVAVLVAVALAMVAAGAVVGGVIVAAGGSSAFAGTLARAIATRGAAGRTPKPPEPAYELYVLGQLRRDLRSAFGVAAARMADLRIEATDFADRHGDGVTMPLAMGAAVGAWLGSAVGALLGALLAIPVLVVAAVVIGVSWVFIGLLRLAERVRRRVRRTSYDCPVCHERFPLPVYVCPACRAEHHRLVPGRWGIVKRECQCGQVALPTTVLMGRQRVPQQCPSGHPLAGIIGYAEVLRYALVAGPSAGKSTFLAGALRELDDLSATGTLALSVLEDSRHDFDAALRNLASGVLPPKTSLGVNPALVAEIQGTGRARVLSLYDVAGESYGGEDLISELRFLEAPSGLVLLVDPLALDQITADHAAELAAVFDQVRPSSEDPMRVLERTAGALAAAGVKAATIPMAIVIAKCDVFGIDEEIDAMRSVHGDAAPRVWIERHGAGNFVRAVTSTFRDVGWFSATALGRTPDPQDRSAFTPVGTAAPLLWLMRQQGVAPAARAFRPANTAEALGGATAADFPPISRLGWGLRVLPATVVTLLAVAGIAVGAGSVLRSVSGSAGASQSRAVDGASGAVRDWASGDSPKVRCAALSRRLTIREFGGSSATATARCRRELTYVRRQSVQVVGVDLTGDDVALVAVAGAGSAVRYEVHRSGDRWTIIRTAGSQRVARQRVRALVGRWAATTSARGRCGLLTVQGRLRASGQRSIASCARSLRGSHHRLHLSIRRLRVTGAHASGLVRRAGRLRPLRAVQRLHRWRLERPL